MYQVTLVWAVIFLVIIREFARWKVRNTAIERRDLIRNPVPLMPEFQRSVRLLGRRPTTQQFIDTIIKKYGTHILISATLGGKRGSLASFAHFHAWLTVFYTLFLNAFYTWSWFAYVLHVKNIAYGIQERLRRLLTNWISSAANKRE